MKSQFKKVAVVVALSALVSPLYAGIETNEPAPLKVQPSVDVPQREVAQSPISQESRSPGQIEADLAKEYYKDCVQNLKWALGIIIGLVVGIVGYAFYKSGREYKEVLAEAREAYKEARAASDKAREYEEKARERLSSVDEVVGSKLEEIEEKGKTLITNLIREAEKQRKISELWNEGVHAAEAEDFELAATCFGQMVTESNFKNAVAYNNWGSALYELAKRKEGMESEAFFRASFEKYEKAVQIKPDLHEAYNNWGAALCALAKRKEGAESEALFRASFEKYEKAVQIKPDKHDAYSNWGAALGELAKRKDGVESEALFQTSFEKYEKAVQIKPDYHKPYNGYGAVLIELAKRRDVENRGRVLEEAERKWLKAESIKEGSSAYNLACVCALLGKEAECRKWLETARRCGTLPTFSHAMADADLESVRDKEWFRQIQWPDEAK